VYDRAFLLIPRRCVRTGALSGASVREVYDRAFLLVPRRCVRRGAWSGVSAREVYDRAFSLVLRRCVRTDRLGIFLVAGTFLSESE
jgi:hypothetical protein